MNKDKTVLVIGNGEDYSDHNVVGIAQVCDGFNIDELIREFIYREEILNQLSYYKAETKSKRDFYIIIFTDDSKNPSYQSLDFYQNRYWGGGCILTPVKIEEIPDYVSSDFVYYRLFKEFMEYGKSVKKILWYSTTLVEWK